MDVVMPFGDHLEELRKRLIFALLGLLPILVAALAFSKPLVLLLIEPVLEAQVRHGLSPQMIQTAPAETFMASLQLAIIMTILVGSPWLIYQLWLFVAPGLYARERRFVHLLLPMSGLLTVISIVFLYKLVMPLVVGFFLMFGASIEGPPARTAPLPEGVTLPTLPMLDADPDSPEPGQMWVNLGLRELRVAIDEGDEGVAVLGMPLTRTASIEQQYRVAEYIKMFLSMAMGFALGFQTPVVILLLGWLGLIEPATLGKFRRQVVMVCLVIGAVLTPADPMSMLALAIPLYALFELGGLMLRWLPAQRVSRGFGRSKEGPDAGDE
ncbi:MAG TPA: twin-arginine translocase subunit TatC [Phycisphaerales bacterium]|nr:twin-arginine translocase subunit TatC [Phycisphaerales bacterium]